jgi:hypothetical protein
MTYLALTKRQIAIAALLGVAAAVLSLLNVAVPIGEGLELDPGEIFVSLGAALGGPLGGLLAGFLKGIVYAPERNVPSHMLAGFVWGLLYIYLWRFTANRKNGKWVRIALWSILMPFYYYVLLLPLNLWILAALNLKTSFSSLFMEVAPLIIPEIIGTIAVTDIILAVIPDKLASPVGSKSTE